MNDRWQSIVWTLGATLLVSVPAVAQPLPTIGPRIRIDAGGSFAANETTAAVSPSNPLVMVAGWNDWRRSGASELINSAFALTTDGGMTWTDWLLRPPPPNQSAVEGDPFAAADPRTSLLWAGAISFSAQGQSGVYVAPKSPASALFSASVMARTAIGTDKPWMAAGPRPGVPDSTRLYIAYNEGLIYSDDLGATYTPPQALAPGVGFLPRVGPEGQLYIAYWDYVDGVMMKRSLDGGLTFTTHVIATRLDFWGVQEGTRFGGSFRAPAFAGLAVDPQDGTLYATYFDSTSFGGGNWNVDVYFTKSTDEGSTWTVPVILNGDGFPAGDQFMSWIEVDETGGLHVIWVDSRHGPVPDGQPNAFFDVYYAYSVNGGDRWFEYRLTPESWNSNDDGLDRPQQFIGDYMSIAVADRRVRPVYIDLADGNPDIYTTLIDLPLPGDVDGDGQVDFLDLLDMLSHWGPCPSHCAADLDGSGVVDFGDLLALLASWS